MISDSLKCTGCGACFNVCPKSAISMQPRYGYEYPIINNTLCIKCNMCSNVCMLEKNQQTLNNQLKYEFRMSGDDILKSSSGGFCYSMSKAFIEKLNGIVYAAVYDSRNKIVVHQRIDSASEIEKTRGSKYVKSHHYHVFKTIKNDLENGLYVLFIGLPCENHGLLNFLNKKYDKLYTISLLCGGAVSSDFFKKYIDELEKVYKDNVKSINFRNKSFGSSILCTSVKLVNGKDKILKARNDYFIPLEGSKYVRPSCHTCSLSPEHILSDFITGDCFGGTPREKGVSVIVVSNNKRINGLFKNLEIYPIENKNLLVSSRAINNNKRLSAMPSEEEYNAFYNESKDSLKHAVKKNIISKYTFKQKTYRVMPNWLKAKITK